MKQVTPILTVSVMAIMTLSYRATAQSLIRVMSKYEKRTAGQQAGPTSIITKYSFAEGPDKSATAPPTISDFTPKEAAKGETVTITGSNFDKGTTVTLGEEKVQGIKEITSTSITVIAGDGKSGKVKVKNSAGEIEKDGFVYVKRPQPVIDEISPKHFAQGERIIIIGKNFTADPLPQVAIDGVAEPAVTYLNATSIAVDVSNKVTDGIITIHTAGGVATYPRRSAGYKYQGNADLTLPDVGQNGLNIIPTPTFSYFEPYVARHFAFGATVWGNTLGLDSTKQRIGNKLLLPQTSLFGLKAEIDTRLNFISSGDDAVFSFVAEFNFLYKKVSYYDTTAKATTNFNPFMIHPRVGLTSTFWEGKLFASAFGNLLTVQTENDQFAQFFGTKGKNAFAFWDVSIGGMFGVGNSDSQFLKVDINMIIQNGNTKQLYNSNNSVIPNIKLGFYTAL